MKLSKIEYDVLMGAIENAKNQIADDAFIDPYADNPEGYTNETFAEALKTAEKKLQAFNPYIV